jgi:hypothetical protein
MKKTYYISRNIKSKEYEVNNIGIHATLLFRKDGKYGEMYVPDQYLIEDCDFNKEWILLETIKGNIVDKIFIDLEQISQNLVYNTIWASEKFFNPYINEKNLLH